MRTTAPAMPRIHGRVVPKVWAWFFLSLASEAASLTDCWVNAVVTSYTGTDARTEPPAEMPALRISSRLVSTTRPVVGSTQYVEVDSYVYASGTGLLSFGSAWARA